MSTQGSERPAKRVKVGRTLEIKSPGQGSLMSFYGSSRFSDILVVAGPPGKAENFHLHQIVVCLKSVFFDKMCKNQQKFKEGINKKISLPEIKPDTFKVIVKWLYDGGYTLPAKFNEKKKDVIDHYAAANFLQICSLKKEITKQIANLIKLDATDPLPGRANRLDQPGIFMERLCKFAQLSDWEDIRSVALASNRVWYWCNYGLTKIARNDGNIWNAVELDALQSEKYSSYCHPCCRKGVHYSTSDLCNSCRRNDVHPRKQITSGQGFSLRKLKKYWGETDEEDEYVEKTTDDEDDDVADVQTVFSEDTLAEAPQSPGPSDFGSDHGGEEEPVSDHEEPYYDEDGDDHFDPGDLE